ncbi:MAG: hypothetical protein GY829_06290 [Gammaproteobacteria bacterium]|nr:hypothetical protein [Gammaproteobacteria bacterium]
MSMQIITMAVKVIGTAMAAKTAIDGLKEGNLLKAVMGGVNAYFGASSLMSSSAYGQAYGNVNGSLGDAVAAGTEATFDSAAIGADAVNGMTDAGAGIAEVAANTQMPAMMNGAESAMNASIGNTGFSPTNFSLEGAVNPLAGSSEGLLSRFGNSVSEGVNSFGNDIKSAINGNDQYSIMTNSNDGGLLSKAGNLLKDNKQLVGSGMQLLAGQQNKEFMEEQMAENRRREDEAIAREKELWRNSGQAPSYQYGYGG